MLVVASHTCDSHNHGIIVALFHSTRHNAPSSRERSIRALQARDGRSRTLCSAGQEGGVRRLSTLGSAERANAYATINAWVPHSESALSLYLLLAGK